MPIVFPSFDITGIRPSRWYAEPIDWKQITEEYQFEDGGKDFNEVAANAPRHWEYGHTGLSFADAQQFDDFYNLVRLAQSFDFKDKYGAIWHNVYIESYTRNHDAHKSWAITVTFHLVNYDGSFTPAPPPATPPPVPTGLMITGFSTTTISVTCDDMSEGPLDPPTGFTATAESSTTVLLAWDSDVPPADPTGFTATVVSSTEVLLDWD